MGAETARATSDTSIPLIVSTKARAIDGETEARSRVAYFSHRPVVTDTG